MDDSIKDEILKSIELLGSALPENASKAIVIGNRNGLAAILDYSNGLPKVRFNVAKDAKLILSAPLNLKALSPFAIRCCLCNKVINYPAWYYKVSYSVNVIHYFICFDGSENSKPTAKCYRRG